MPTFRGYRERQAANSQAGGGIDIAQSIIPLLQSLMMGERDSLEIERLQQLMQLSKEQGAREREQGERERAQGERERERGPYELALAEAQARLAELKAMEEEHAEPYYEETAANAAAFEEEKLEAVKRGNEHAQSQEERNKEAHKAQMASEDFQKTLDELTYQQKKLDFEGDERTQAARESAVHDNARSVKGAAIAAEVKAATGQAMQRFMEEQQELGQLFKELSVNPEIPPEERIQAMRESLSGQAFIPEGDDGTLTPEQTADAARMFGEKIAGLMQMAEKLDKAYGEIPGNIGNLVEDVEGLVEGGLLTLPPDTRNNLASAAAGGDYPILSGKKKVTPEILKKNPALYLATKPTVDDPTSREIRDPQSDAKFMAMLPKHAESKDNNDSRIAVGKLADAMGMDARETEIWMKMSGLMPEDQKLLAKLKKFTSTGSFTKDVIVGDPDFLKYATELRVRQQMYEDLDDVDPETGELTRNTVFGLSGDYFGKLSRDKAVAVKGLLKREQEEAGVMLGYFDNSSPEELTIAARKDRIKNSLDGKHYLEDDFNRMRAPLDLKSPIPAKQRGMSRNLQQIPYGIPGYTDRTVFGDGSVAPIHQPGVPTQADPLSPPMIRTPLFVDPTESDYRAQKKSQEMMQELMDLFKPTMGF